MTLPHESDDDGTGENVKYVFATLPAFGILLLDGRLMEPKDSVAQVRGERRRAAIERLPKLSRLRQVPP